MNDDKNNPEDPNRTPQTPAGSEPTDAPQQPVAPPPASGAQPQLPADAAETARFPEQAPAAAGAAASGAYPAAGPGSGPGTGYPAPDAARGRRRRNLLIGAAAAVALLAVGGGAYAIGANTADDDDDRPAFSEEGRHDGANQGDDDGHDRDDDRRDVDDRDDRADRDDSQVPGTGAADLPPADAASLRDAAEAAITETGASGVTSIDVERGGYEVEVVLADGTSPDVFVAEDRKISTGADRDDDQADDPVLDLDRLSDLVAAALAASESASGADGRIDSLSTSDDPGTAYEVSIRLSDGRDVDVDLDADLAVVRTDVDDD